MDIYSFSDPHISAGLTALWVCITQLLIAIIKKGKDCFTYIAAVALGVVSYLAYYFYYDFLPIAISFSAVVVHGPSNKINLSDLKTFETVAQLSLFIIADLASKVVLNTKFFKLQMHLEKIPAYLSQSFYYLVLLPVIMFSMMILLSLLASITASIFLYTNSIY